MHEKRRGGTATAGTRTQPRERIEDTIRAAVAEAVADREERETSESQRSAKHSSWMSAFFVVVLLGFIASGLYCFFEIREMSVPLDEAMGTEAEAVDVHLYSVVMRLEDFKEEAGHYPVSLDRLGIPVEGNLKYNLVSGAEYHLQYVSDDVVRTYHSNQPASRLLGADLD